MKKTVFDEATQARLLATIEKSLTGKRDEITNNEAAMLFYWSRHQDDPVFSFVPEHYRLGIAKQDLEKKVTKKKAAK